MNTVQERPNRRASSRSIVVGAVTLFAIGNFLFSPLMAREFGVSEGFSIPLYGLVGAVGAQAAMHAVWCVFASINLRAKVVAAVGVGLLWYGAWALGCTFAVLIDDVSDPQIWEIMTSGLLCLPIFLLAVQAPLWPLRIWLRWRIVQTEGRTDGVAPAAIGIRHILAGTIVVAVALTAAKGANFNTQVSDHEVFITLLITALVCAGVSLCTTLPVVVATLRARRVWPVLGAALLLDVILFVGAVSIFNDGPSSLPSFLYTIFGAMFAGFVGPPIVVLLLLRQRGYRLLWGRGSGTTHCGVYPE